MSLENNRRIAKNTLMLYFRMLFIMGVSLYTSRIVLNTLGINDYGIYNIIGGIVILFSFLNTAMTSATQRFLNIEIGRKEFGQLNKVFSTSLNVHISIAFIVLILSETFGLWLINTQLNLPLGRMDTVNWVYQFSIITFIISIIQVPYNASIIAHERMSFYAYISVIEVFLKLAIVFILQHLSFDKLKTYSILLSFVSLFIITIYAWYCNRKFESCRYKYHKDSSLYKQLLSFSGWSLFGSVAIVGKTQIINILLNLFFGVVVNAAVGITNQISAALNSFVLNFQTAFNPQIVKSYAANETNYLMNLIFRTSKFSYFLLFFISLPVLLNTEVLLDLWLTIVPEYSVVICQLSIVYLLIEAISGPLWMSVQATGNIRKYQIVISLIILLNIPISFFLLKSGLTPYSVFYLNIAISLIALLVRLLFLHSLINLSIMQFLKNVVYPIVLVTFVSIILPFFVVFFITGSLGIYLSIFSSLFSVGMVVFCLGLNKNERSYILNKISSKSLKL